MYDSLGKKVTHLPPFGNWEDTIMFYRKSGYHNGYTLNNERTGKPAIDPEGTIGLMWLFNLGDINNVKGDEIALVPESDHGLDLNSCYIYSLCSGQWVQVYRFNVSENAFTYPYGETEFAPFRNIPGFLERVNGQWVHMDLWDVWYKPNGVEPTLRPLIVGNCQPTQSYVPAPSLSVTGDFDGDGKPDTLSQFVTDSLGNQLETVLISDDLDEYNSMPYKMGYHSVVTLNGKATPLPVTDIELLCLINLGNINKTKGDEIAIVELVRDYSASNHCTIYSYCNNRWVPVFSFYVNETVFDYEGDVRPMFTSIPGVLEKQNGRWHYFVWFDESFIDQDGKNIMKPLKVANCN